MPGFWQRRQNPRLSSTLTPPGTEVKPQGRTHSCEQIPTAPPCPGSRLPSETPSSMEHKGSTRGETTRDRHRSCINSL